MANVTKDLGLATAYAYHKAGGGTLTEAEFEQKMVDITTAVDDAETAKDDAVAAKNAAEASAQNISQSAQQIATNTSDIADLKEDLSDINDTLPMSPFNLIDFDKIIFGGFINGNTGEFTKGTSGVGLNCCTDFIEVEPSTAYYLSGLRTNNNAVNMVEYDANKVFVKSDGVNPNPTHAITTAVNTKYVRISFVSTAVYRDNKLSKVHARSLGELQTKQLIDAYAVSAPGLEPSNLVRGVRFIGTGIAQDDVSRYTTLRPIYCKKGTEIRQAKLKVGFFAYDSKNLTTIVEQGFGSWTSVILPEDSYVHFNFAKSNDAEVTESDKAELLKNVEILEPIESKLNNQVRMIAEATYFVNGSVGNQGNLNAVSTYLILPTYGATSISILLDKTLDTGHQNRFQLTTFNIDNGRAQTSLQNRVTVDKTIVTNSNFYEYKIDDGSVGFALALYELDETGASVPLRVETFDASKVYFLRKYEASKADYVLESNMSKRYIDVTKIGRITNLQAFVKYNGNYISVVEGKITRQDSNFGVVETKDVTIGHANSLQRGSGNLAYASGWNDNAVYIVDLDTLTVTGSIALPTTGYTTAVVDDVQKLVYIFQSDATSTWKPWNFIVYDYQNNETKATYKTIPFANIQGVDLLNDRIILMHGMGTASSPSGMHVFNTRGEDVADYYLTTVPSTVEYEGVYIDRDDHTLYISDVGANVYKLT